MKATESVIEIAILHYLNLLDDTFAFKIPDQRECRDGIYKKHPYMPRGIPDIYCRYHAETLFFEVKTDEGRLSPSQVKIHAKMGNVYTVRNIDEVKAVLRLIDFLHYPTSL